ncbi:MAG: L-serine ammonia-lyase [Clostridia bacterium]|nr:L-serine ammonia-lyase [Clostridia bacterium]
MKSLKELYKIGRGPSSSHTMGPQKAALLFEEQNPSASSFKAVLYGSLAQTGKGHGTDVVLKKTFKKTVEVIFNLDEKDIPHPNTLDLYALNDAGETVCRWRVMSVGGGAIEVEGQKSIAPKDVYPHNTFEQIKEYCEENSLSIYEYVKRFEPDIDEYLLRVWERMQKSIWKGLEKSGTLPGGLNVERKAQHLFSQVDEYETPETRENRIVCAYAFAVSEQNAAGGTIVTAPTCGSSGILPAVLRYAQERHGFKDEDILRALSTAGIIGNIVKTNASISGAECGCQAECGTACSMAAAALASLFEMSLDQIEYAAEVAMEHHLGLTCDPVDGLVQIPCIERNAVSAMRAINAASLANFLTSSRQISFDAVVETMYATGKDINSRYRETAEAGLAQGYNKSRLKRIKKVK